LLSVYYIAWFVLLAALALIAVKVFACLSEKL
jgi:hypothetical protein